MVKNFFRRQALFSIFLICGLGLALGCALIFGNVQFALSQSAVQRCVRELVEVGVSPDAAAGQCIQGGGTGLAQQETCIERAQFKTYYGSPHKREDGRTEYIYPFLDINDQDCWSDHRNLFKPKTICWVDKFRLRIATEQQAMQQCRGYSNTSTPQNDSRQTNPAGSGVVIINGQPTGSGSPAAIARCMDSLLYRTEERKPFPGWICVPNDVNCSTVRVRTEMRESTAIQACQNAR